MGNVTGFYRKFHTLSSSAKILKIGYALRRHVNVAYRAYAMDWGLNNILQMGKNSGPTFSRLCTKVHEILAPCRGSLVLSNAHVRLSISYFIQKIFAIKCRSRRKPNKCKSFLSPIFCERRPRLFYIRLVSAIYCPPFGKMWLSSDC